MNKKLLTFLLCLPIMLSCYSETITYKTESEKPVIIEPQTIQEEETTMLKSIPESHNYFIKDNKELFSIDSQGVNTIDIIDQDGEPIELVDFFRKNKESFFTIKTYNEIDNPDYDPECDPEDPETETCAPEKITEEIITFYKQAGGEVSKIDVLPKKPPVSRTQYESQTFTIQNNDYEGKMVTDVRNEVMGSEARFFLVNGTAAYVPEVGLFFHVQDGLYNEQYMVHENGLYIFPEKSKSVVRINTTGVLW